MYALNLDDDGRILSVTLERFASEEQPKVEALPEGDVTDYRYIDGAFVYEPTVDSEPEEEPTIEERIERIRADVDFIAMMADIEL